MGGAARAVLCALVVLAGCTPDEGKGPGDTVDTDVVDTPEVVCGDAICDATEDAVGCAADCASTCGDGACTHSEQAAVCPADCAADCGDGWCTHTEDPEACPGDCPAACGDGACTHSETASSCAADCAADCGDGWCTHAEDATSCPGDCRATCGDAACTHAETPSVCPEDCADDCGDGWCTHTEDAASCPGDCAVACGDGLCTHGEDAARCPGDCPKDCGDGACTHDEAYTTCADDCATTCGDGACAGDEDAASCPGDCAEDCGDLLCTHTEDAASCPGDCPATCPDAACTHDETHASCPQDCPDCPGGEGCPRGLEARPAPSACALEGDPGSFAYRLRSPAFATGFTRPVQVLAHPGEPDTLFVVEITGTILAISRQDPTQRRVVLDISPGTHVNGEGGLLSMAFAPDYAETGHIYVARFRNAPIRTELERFTVDPPFGGTADPGSRELILAMRKAASLHFGGQILFDKDGMLLLSVGDSFFEYGALAQHLDTPHGKVLRIDVKHPADGLAYGIPADNPFVGSGSACGDCFMDADLRCDHTCSEIWAYGFRNPWRCSLDADDRLWCGDVGSVTWEEVNLVEKGQNYGWNCYEGPDVFDMHDENEPCAPQGTTRPPVHSYLHYRSNPAGTAAVTGGVVYRGRDLPDLVGQYIFADSQLGQIWALTHEDGVELDHRELTSTSAYIVAIGEDVDHELYFVDHAFGALHQLEPAGSSDEGTFPRTLSETGCYADLGAVQPQPDLLPYEVASPLWSDGTVKKRYLRLPSDTATVELPAGLGSSVEAAEQALDLPDGSLLMKEFFVPAPGGLAPLRPLETRFLIRRSEERWDAYTYRWRSDGSDADLVLQGTTGCYDAWGDETTEPCAFTHYFPSTSECFACHTTAAGRTLGARPLQLNRLQDYGGTLDNQLRALDHLGIFDPPLDAEAKALPVYPDPFGDAPLGERARAYLASNCSMCHQPTGTMPSLDFRFGTALADTMVCDADPVRGDFGLPDARLIAPGAPASSVLLHRVSHRGPEQMPPLATSVVHEEAVALLTAWIADLETCTP
ncbi:MAG: PQQ-dependent sugar dehydrogenase [Alphaproteobacteria bacterium]|nr:PQQ-dependent sugar dehydrogenase [Alphaproteobacteria bacterium]